MNEPTSNGRAAWLRDVGARLGELGEVAGELSARDLERDAADLAERLAKGRFFVACVGQFKRGKSTVLNALCGRDILPTGVVPVTTAVTVLRYGDTLSADVRYFDGRREAVDPSSLDAYVSEVKNPENVKGVAAVEVSVPSDLLRSGMCLVDTPGLGSVFETNAETTRAFIPHLDAALVVVGTDPPISGEELDLVRQVVERVGSILLVLNKCDRVTDAESHEAAAFASRVIERRLGLEVGEVYRVSALERAAGRPTRDWPRLESALAGLSARAGTVVEASAARGLSRVASGLLREIDERRQALERPIEESERRLASLRSAIQAAEYTLRELSARMKVEQLALADRFGEIRNAFLAGDGGRARRELEDRLDAAPFTRGPGVRTLAIDLAHDIARRRVTEWSKQVEPAAETLYAETIARFVDLANEFVIRLAPESSAGALTSDEIAVARRFQHESQFFFTSMLTLAEPGFWAWVFDWVRPRRMLVRSSLRQATRYLDRLLVTNSARVANDLAARVEESQRKLEREIRDRLSRLVESAERALERARAQHAAGLPALSAERERLSRLRDRVADAQRVAG